MNNFALFVCGVVVTIIAGMGVITSQVFMGYSDFIKDSTTRTIDNDDEQIEQTV